MKRLMLYCLLLFSAYISAQTTTESHTIQILPESKLTITGDTNIKEFECGYYTAQIEEKTPLKYTLKDSQILFQQAELRLENKGFDCGNKAINKDFHELIQTGEYPEIILKLNKISLESPILASANVTICIAGLEKDYNLPVYIKNEAIQHFKGSLQLNIRDFNLEPPEKFFGMIVVKEEIEINFDLSVKNQSL